MALMGPFLPAVKTKCSETVNDSFICFFFLGGDGDDYICLSLKDGGLRLSVNLGSGRLDTGIKPKHVTFNDDLWHHVIVSRKAREVSEDKIVFIVSGEVFNLDEI